MISFGVNLRTIISYTQESRNLNNIRILSKLGIRLFDTYGEPLPVSDVNRELVTALKCQDINTQRYMLSHLQGQKNRYYAAFFHTYVLSDKPKSYHQRFVKFYFLKLSELRSNILKLFNLVLQFVSP